MRIFIDIDNTIFNINHMDYENPIPIKENIIKVNKLFEIGHIITMWTARGTLSNKCFFEMTYKQLIDNGIKFHELRMGKPAFDLFIDDKAINSIWDWNDTTINNVLNKTLTHNMIIIVQARNGSTRLPNKVMLPFYNNKTILDIICERLKKNKYLIPVCIATTINSNDDKLYEKYEKNKEIFCYRGDENNVLLRFINCADYYGKKIIIRVCSDNPFISLKYMENLIDTYIEKHYDYISYSIDERTSCLKSHIGIFSEIVSLDCLKSSLIKTDKQHFLENVTEYIYENPDKFLVKLINTKFNSSIINDIRLTLDTQEDFDILKNIYQYLTIEDDINFYEILNYLHENKNILDIMSKNIKIYKK